jgi:glycosyltransferase involved in cell wall biosynthesis
MTSRPKISVVLPTFNGRRYLDESITSCLGQSVPDIELIIVNDGSSDSTGAIAESWRERDPRVVVIAHKNNRGLPEALNSGFQKSSGAYLTWTSDDNIFRQTALESMGQYLDRHPIVSVVYAGYEIINADGTVVGSVRPRPPEGLVLGNVVGPCFMFRREVLEEVGRYDPSMILAEDYDFWLRAFARVRLCGIEEFLYQYRRHESSLSETKSFEIDAAAHRVKLKNAGVFRRVSPRMRARGYLKLADSSVLHSGGGSSRWLFLAKAVLSHPHPVFRRLVKRLRKEPLAAATAAEDS